MRISQALPIFGLLGLSSSVFATDFAFIDQKHHWHFGTNFAQTGSAKVDTHPVKGSHLKYTEGTSSLFYTYNLNAENSLTGEAGLNYIRVNWPQNPRFKEDNYYYGLLSLGWISHSIKQWRWVLNGGVSFDTTTFNFGKSGVYYALIWGRYQYTDTVAMHMGFFGYYGAHNGYMLPVLGVDWWASPKWELVGVFPIDASVRYHFTKHWMTAVVATSFGGPYRFPRRAHEGRGRYNDGIFEVYSTGVEWDLKFHQAQIFSIGAGVGYNFGGWILIKDHHNRHGKYFKFDESVYGRATLNVSF